MEEFFINWENRKPLSFIIVLAHRIEKDDAIMELIGKYKKLGIIKKFESLTYHEIRERF